jgi:hypothetical protein
MQRIYRVYLLTALLLVLAASLFAQSMADPSGHWSGAIQVPNREIQFEIDLAKDAQGGFTGAISISEQNLKGVPLRKVSVNGKSVAFEARKDQPLAGVLSDDGQEIVGGYSFENFSIPFSMKRTGAAQLDPPARLARIGSELEGNWDGTLNVAGQQFHLGLALTNGTDGSGSGRLVDYDEGELQLPVSAITTTDLKVVMEFKSMGSSYAATLNKERTAMAGIYRKGELAGELTLARKGAGE